MIVQWQKCHSHSWW